MRGELKSAWAWSDGPVESVGAAVIDAKADENGSITDGLGVPQVEKQVEEKDTEPDVSEAESKPKKKKSKKKAA